jgi:hypothetical protein
MTNSNNIDNLCDAIKFFMPTELIEKIANDALDFAKRREIEKKEQKARIKIEIERSLLLKLDDINFSQVQWIFKQHGDEFSEWCDNGCDGSDCTCECEACNSSLQITKVTDNINQSLEDFEDRYERTFGLY